MSAKAKQVFFTLIPVCAALVLLTLVELALRLFAPSLAVPLTRPLTIDGVDYLQVNKSYLERYFPASSVNVPEFKTALIKKVKTPGMLRVICLGESSMLGTPYVMTATIPGVVRKQLRHLYPDREIEVLNLGAAAINTNVVRHLAGTVLDLQPDAILFYAGHNEFYGPDGVGASFIERPFPSLSQFKYILRDLRLVRAFQGILAKLSNKPDQQNLDLMQEVSRGAQVRLNSQAAERSFNLFEENLRSIIGIFRSHGIPIILSTVTSNLMFPPFASDTIAGAQDPEAMFNRGDTASLAARVDACLGADSTNALAQYWKGRIALLRGDTTTSRRFLARARDSDLLKFRAPEEINRIIVHVCAATNTPCVDADSAFSSLSPGKIPAYNLFSEHLHPTARGYAVIANLCTEKLEGIDLSPLRSARPPESLLAYSPDTLSICWLDLTYGELAINAMTKKWPFHGTPTPTPTFDRAGADLRQIVIRVINHGIGWDEGCYQTATRFVASGQPREALTTYDALIEEFWFNAAARQLRADLLRDLGEYAGAAEEYQRSLAMHPDNPEARISLGFIFINHGKFDAAIRELTAALSSPSTRRNRDRSARANYALAAAYANKKDLRMAEEFLTEALRADQTFGPAKELRAQLERYQKRR